ncbi:nesprin-2-like isoform X2 [Festucalex cinctus]
MAFFIILICLLATWDMRLNNIPWALIKDLEEQSGLRAAAVSAASRLLEPGGDDQDSGEDPEDGLQLHQSPSRDPVGTSERVGRLERDWSSLLAAVAAVQRALHEWWTETLSQRGALQELHIWLAQLESGLEERQSGVDRKSCTSAELRLLLKYYKECQTEMSAQQATLDHASQPSDPTEEEGQRGRDDANRLAEDQGSLQRLWLTRQTTLDIQIGELEEDLSVRTEQEVHLERINTWMADQKWKLESARSLLNRTDLQHDPHQDLEEQIRMKQVALQELADSHGQRGGGGAFVCLIDQSRAACEELAQLNRTVGRDMAATRQLRLSVDEQMDEMTRRLASTGQMRDLLRGPALSLPAHKDLRRRLQSLCQDAKSCESGWERLRQTLAALQQRVHPDEAHVLARRIHAQAHSWSRTCSRLDQDLQRSLVLQTSWESHAFNTALLWECVMAIKEEAAAAVPTRDGAARPHLDRINEDLRKLQTLQERADALQCDLQGALEASKDLIGCLDPSVAALVQSESRLLSRAILQLGRTLAAKRRELQEELPTLQEVGNLLETSESALERCMELLDMRRRSHQQHAELLDAAAAVVADLDVLNELSGGVTLNDDDDVRRLQRLNRGWADASARTQDACSELQAEASRHQSFQQKCESWMSFLQTMEERLTVDLAGSYHGLQQQLRVHKRFQVEESTGHQILHSLVADALRLLQGGDVDDRSDLILTLTQLRQQWRGAAQRAEQRRCLAEERIRHWQRYRRGLEKLQRFLADAQDLLPGPGPLPGGLGAARRSLRRLQHARLLFQRRQGTLAATLELGGRLFSTAEQQAQDELRAQLGEVREEWDRLRGLLARRLDLAQTVVQNWERCEAQVEDKMLQLKDMKTRLDRPMSERQATSDQDNEERLEDGLDEWALSLSQLSAMKTDLSQYAMADDVLLLHEHVQHLHCHWEELCLKVSQRKQEIGDRLNAWMMFKEKNAELCDWLAHMENKMADTTHLNIEEMVEKLKKECMEEMNLFSENKRHLKQLGEQMMDASNKTKESDAVNDAVNHVDRRWQHLFQHVEARVGKLKETLAAVQQLDERMSELRVWLAGAEARLAQPLVFHLCHADDIQRKLHWQQEAQSDIDDHAATVASVLSLCDQLARDVDACGSESERDAILQTARSLDRRWNNICAASLDRKMRIEETWRLWRKFLADFAAFEDWLTAAELTAANPNSGDVVYTRAKEELKRFEAFQRQVQERLTQLELLNKQYRRLARENRTDSAGQLRLRADQGNQRWDGLQRRVAAVLRRLKHFTSQREDFEGTRESILVWLTEMDLQLTNVEHFSESNMEDKMRRLKAFQQQITLNANKIDALIVFGENLIQKSTPADAALIEDELEELHSYCHEVFGRVARFNQRLLYRRPIEVVEEERSDLENPPGVTAAASWWSEPLNKDVTERQTSCQLLVPPREHSGRETPVSVDSIPLEWDHTVDVGGSSSHEDDEDVAFVSVLSAGDTPSWHRPPSPLRSTQSRNVATTSFHQRGYVKLMSECSGSVDDIKRVKSILKDERKAEGPPPLLPGLSSSTTHKPVGTGVIERWEVEQAQEVHQEVQQEAQVPRGSRQQWHKLNAELRDVTSWLDRKLVELEALQKIPPSTGLKHFEDNVRMLKETQRTFCLHKRALISLNLAGAHFLSTDGERPAELKAGLASANHSWMRACGALERWEAGLHTALLQCQDFHESLHSLLLWLARADQKVSAASQRQARPSYARLLEQRDALQVLREELRGRQAAASSLQGVGAQLLVEAGRDRDDCAAAREKVHAVGNKMKMLLAHVQRRLDGIDRELDHLQRQREEGEEPAEADLPRRGEDGDDVRRPLLSRALRAAFPLHVLFLLLLAFTCLVAPPPGQPSSYGCSLANNFARSFYPMLRYTNGPPPT